MATPAQASAVGSARGMDLRHRGVFQEPAGRVAGMALLAGGGGTAGPPEGSQERRTGKTSERRGDDQMFLLRSHRVCTVFRGGGAAQLFSPGGVRGDSRSDGPPPRRRESEGSGTSARIRASVVRRRQKCTSAELPPTFPRSRLPAASRAKARWICRFASSISMRSGYCPCSFKKQPEKRLPGGERRSTCARTESS